MEYLKKNYKELLALGFVAAYWTGVYYYIKYENDQKIKAKSPKKVIKAQSSQKKVSQHQYEMPEIKPDPTPSEIAAIIKQHVNPSSLSFEAIVQITEKSIELIKSQYIKKTIENREARRKHLHKNNSEYYRSVIAYNQEIEALLQQANDMLLLELGIPKQQFESQLTQLLTSEEMIQQIIMLQQQLRQKLKLFLATEKSKIVTIDQLKVVMLFQVQCLKESKELITDGVKRVIKGGVDEESNQLVNLVINTVLADLIWEKYELEEENLANEAINQYVMSDVELQQSLIAMQQESSQLLQECYGMQQN